jgi:uncharacterized membrane protein (Fun14 family)
MYFSEYVHCIYWFPIDRGLINKSYIFDILDIYYVHPYYSKTSSDSSMITDAFTSISATLGGGFLVGVLLGYAIKKVLKIIAVVVGLFLAGLAYLQYQQIASFDWNRIEGVVTATLGNITSQISSSQHGVAALAMSNLGIPLTSSMSAGFAVGFMKG